ncbi:MAG TPA: DUF2933 domain-containing protein [Nitrospiria bacterium]|nr:DUF2933 domain-containing protein [Nitrospiria bacterium]
MNMKDQHGPERNSWFRRPANLALCGFLLIAGFFLLSEHRAHFFGILPWLLLLACPVLHLFMHRGHKRGEHRHREGEER